MFSFIKKNWFPLISMILMASAFSPLFIPRREKHDEIKVLPCRYVSKINFDGHSYIFLRNSWSCSGDELLHDPSCQCLRK